jgi:hypothetical protein
VLAVKIAATHGRTFKLSAAGGLKELTRAAAKEVISPERYGERSAQEAKYNLVRRKNDAKRAVRKLVNAMVKHAKSIPSYDKDRLGESTLASAMYSEFSICPCWPFC